MTRLVGLIGGVSPEATPIYYAGLCKAANTARGGQSSMPVLINALDFGIMAGLYHDENWTAFKAEVGRAALSLKAGGAEALAICSNTTHIGADHAAEATGLPIIHILDALTEALQAQKVGKPFLLGTPFVMEGDFYRRALGERYGPDVVVPTHEDRKETGRIIFDELCRGVVKDSSRERFAAMIDAAKAEGCDGVILGCTELCMIISEDMSSLPVFDTTALHIASIAQFALERG
ncbi:MAG: amino acid racemase [Pseudomonadota bacterium]